MNNAEGQMVNFGLSLMPMRDLTIEDTVIAKAPARGVTHTNFGKQTESTGFQILLAHAAMKVETARLHAFRAADDLDAYAARKEHPGLTARARVRADTALAAKCCREAVEQLASAHGTSSMADNNRMQRLWRHARRQPPRDHRVAGERGDLRENAAGR